MLAEICINSTLCNTFEWLHRLNTSAEFRFSPSGVRLQLLESVPITLGAFHWGTHMFQEYQVDTHVVIGVPLKQIRNILKNTSCDSSSTLIFRDSSIEIKTLGQVWIVKTNVISHPDGLLSIEPSYDGHVAIPFPLFVNTLQTMQNSGSALYVTLKQKNVVFESDQNVKVVFTGLSIQEFKRHVHLELPLEKLLHMFQNISNVSHVTLFFQRDKPLKCVADGVDFYFAPIIPDSHTAEESHREKKRAKKNK